MNDGLYSIRMRASRDGLHISGAERIVREAEIERVTAELTSRARGHERGVPDSITITVDSLAGREVQKLKALPVADKQFKTVGDGRLFSVSELVKAGVSDAAAGVALELLTKPSLSGGNMSGAIVVDAVTGSMHDIESSHGIRARAMDYDENFLPELEHTLERHGLNRTHLKEALVLATKVANAPGAVAELCISDDPGYITGYVASLKFGYIRITPLKEMGETVGGRVFFVDGPLFDKDGYLKYLRETPVLVEGPFNVRK